MSPSTRASLATLIVGLWLGLSVAMWVVATTNFRTVDELLEPGYRAEFSERLAPRTAAEERPLLRFLASELNRRFFLWFGVAELLLAAALLAALWRQRRAGGSLRRAWSLALATAALTAVLALGLGPAIGKLGPPLDFVPRPIPAEMPAEQAAYTRFMRLHHAFTALDLVRVLLLAGIAVAVLRRPPAAEEVDTTAAAA